MALCTLSLMKRFSMALCFVIELQYSWIRCVLPVPLRFLCVPSPSCRSAPGLTSACPSGKAVDNGGFDCGQSRIRHMLVWQPGLCQRIRNSSWSFRCWWLKQRTVVTVATSWPLAVQGCLSAFITEVAAFCLQCAEFRSSWVGRLELAVWFCELCFLKLCFRLGNNCLSFLVTKVTFQWGTSSLKGSNNVIQL